MQQLLVPVPFGIEVWRLGPRRLMPLVQVLLPLRHPFGLQHHVSKIARWFDEYEHIAVAGGSHEFLGGRRPLRG